MLPTLYEVVFNLENFVVEHNEHKNFEVEYPVGDGATVFNNAVIADSLVSFEDCHKYISEKLVEIINNLKNRVEVLENALTDFEYQRKYGPD